jgi:hypothetical protein
MTAPRAARGTPASVKKWVISNLQVAATPPLLRA